MGIQGSIRHSIHDQAQLSNESKSYTPPKQRYTSRNSVITITCVYYNVDSLLAFEHGYVHMDVGKK